MTEIWNSTVIGVGIVLSGLCIGSFLNVVIHRVPRGLSVNDPKRSFCPHCKTTLPAWQNLPILTWVLQRGKCRSCQAPIPVRYLLVEALTGGLYFAAWEILPMTSAMLAIVLFTILVVVTFIDAEHQLIPVAWTTVGSVIALLGGVLVPRLLDLSGQQFDWIHETWWRGLKASALGWLVGFGSLLFVVLLGKAVFGRFKLKLEEATPWKLSEGHGDDPQLHLLVGEEAYSWDDIFYRKTDVLHIEGHGFKVDGKRVQAKALEITRDEIRIGDQKWGVGPLKSLEGKATRVVIPREAMGMGDPHLMGMIGAFLGWPAAVFVIFSSCFYAIAAALVARVGFGKPLPYGPFLAMGAVTWILGGWQLWNWYFEGVRKGF